MSGSRGGSKEERQRSQDGHTMLSSNLKSEAVGLPSGQLWPRASKAPFI